MNKNTTVFLSTIMAIAISLALVVPCVGMSNASPIGDFEFKQMLENMSSCSIPFLNLSNIGLTDEQLTCFCKKSPEVKALNISGCQELEFFDISLLWSLEKLDASYTKITYDQVVKICRKNRDFVELNITGCNDISDEHVSAIQQAFPRLRIIR